MPPLNITHGMTHTLTYSTWKHMRQRCNNPNKLSYPYYGGRGITICKRWIVFRNFLEDMGNRPKGLTIERIDNNKGYYKENCIWATRTKQQRNKRPYKNNTTGISGISWNKRVKKYLVRITIKSKMKYIGLFDKLELAIAARHQAEQKYWGKEA